MLIFLLLVSIGIAELALLLICINWLQSDSKLSQLRLRGLATHTSRRKWWRQFSARVLTTTLLINTSVTVRQMFVESSIESLVAREGAPLLHRLNK